ncbi:MAG TPA: DUF177 domain-containing protein [Candidatus Limnocylindrales bacterium]|nr:DUF177 domain-containing protein [Candidatus Limnocylindrales bacterium]
MIIRIDEIQASPSDFELELHPWEFDSQNDGFVLHSSTQAKIRVSRVGLDIEVYGYIPAELQLECCRCLESKIFPVQKYFHAIYRDAKWMETREEVELEAEDLLVSYYSEDTLNLTEIIREQLILAIPIQVFCKADCAGLCPQCGQNLNFRRCSCREDNIDPRLAVLAKLLEN